MMIFMVVNIQSFAVFNAASWLRKEENHSENMMKVKVLCVGWVFAVMRGGCGHARACSFVCVSQLQYACVFV